MLTAGILLFFGSRAAGASGLTDLQSKAVVDDTTPETELQSESPVLSKRGKPFQYDLLELEEEISTESYEDTGLKQVPLKKK